MIRERWVSNPSVQLVYLMMEEIMNYELLIMNAATAELQKNIQ